MKPSNYPENKSPSGTYSRVQLVCMKIQVQFFRTTTTIQLGPDAFDKSGLVIVMTFLTNLLQKLENYLQKLQKYYAVTAMLCSFRLVPERNLIHQD